MESSSSPWLSLALTVLERFMTMKALTSSCRAADLGTDCSHPIILDAPLMWKPTFEYAFRAFPEDGGVSHGPTSWPNSSPPPLQPSCLFSKHSILFSCLLCSWFSPSYLPHLTNLSSSSEADIRVLSIGKEVELIVHTWCCLSPLALGPDRHDSGGESWFWFMILNQNQI